MTSNSKGENCDLIEVKSEANEREKKNLKYLHFELSLSIYPYN